LPFFFAVGPSYPTSGYNSPDRLFLGLLAPFRGPSRRWTSIFLSFGLLTQGLPPPEEETHFPGFSRTSKFSTSLSHLIHSPSTCPGRSLTLTCPIEILSVLSFRLFRSSLRFECYLLNLSKNVPVSVSPEMAIDAWEIHQEPRQVL